MGGAPPQFALALPGSADVRQHPDIAARATDRGHRARPERPVTPGRLPQQLPLAQPAALADVLREHLPGRFVVAGTIERRLLAAEHAETPEWTIADLSGRALDSRRWPSWTTGRITIADPQQWISTATVTDEAVHRLTRSRVMLGRKH